MPKLRTRFAGSSDVGLLRDRNEDSYLVFPAYRFAAVADGMGGHLSGDVASTIAISTLREFYVNTVGPDRTWPFPYDNELTEEENCVVVGVQLANQQVFGRARQSHNESGMGTTVVAGMFTDDADKVVVGHVGDSRCYRVRDGQLTQLTSDHSLLSEVTEIAPWLSEEEVSQLPSNVITRALGMGPQVVVDLLTTETRPGDMYLLCSDGLNGMLSDEEIRAVVVEGGDDLTAVCEELIAKANAAGGNDNTTVVLIELLEADDAVEIADAQTGGAIATIEAQGGLDVVTGVQPYPDAALDALPAVEALDEDTQDVVPETTRESSPGDGPASSPEAAVHEVADDTTVESLGHGDAPDTDAADE